jgi:hypothetical protein
VRPAAVLYAERFADKSIVVAEILDTVRRSRDRNALRAVESPATVLSPEMTVCVVHADLRVKCRSALRCLTIAFIRASCK